MCKGRSKKYEVEVKGKMGVKMKYFYSQQSQQHLNRNTMPMFDAPKASGKLSQMLADPSLTPQQLFSVPNIIGDIKQKIQTFLTFCLKRRHFTTRMLSLTLNSKYENLQDSTHQKVAQLASEALSSDENAASDFLFGSEVILNNQSDISEKIDEEFVENVETEAERLFSDDTEPTPIQQLDWSTQPDAFEKFELVKFTLAHLKIENKNQTCLGYINKIYASLLRKEGCQFLDFLEQCPEYMDLLIENIAYSSIANLVSLILACEDKSRQYKYEAFKKGVFSKILNFAFENIKNQSQYEGFLSTIEEIFNSTKQSYYEYFEDFKRCADILVEEKTLLKFMEFLSSEDQVEFSNAISYLELVLKRINSEDDQQDYYRQSEPTQPSMKFQHSSILNKFESMLDLIKKSQKYPSICRLSFLNFLVQILKNIKDKPASFDNLLVFKIILNYYFAENSQGMIKNYLFQLLKLSLKRMGKSELDDLIEWMIENGSHAGFVGDTDIVAANMNAVSCFGYSVCFQIQQKQQSFLSRLKSEAKVSLDQTFGRFQTRLANYGKKSEVNSNKDDEFQLNFEIPFKKFDKGDKTERQSETQVGKNQIVIPTLHLPMKTEGGKKITFEEEEVESLIIPQQNSRQQMIQDLKNTKIQLPMKFRLKNPPRQSLQTDSMPKLNDNLMKEDGIKQEKKQKQNKFSLKLQGLFSKTQDLKPAGVSVTDEKFYVKHLLIF